MTACALRLRLEPLPLPPRPLALQVGWPRWHEAAAAPPVVPRSLGDALTLDSYAVLGGAPSHTPWPNDAHDGATNDGAHDGAHDGAPMGSTTAMASTAPMETFALYADESRDAMAWVRTVRAIGPCLEAPRWPPEPGPYPCEVPLRCQEVAGARVSYELFTAHVTTANGPHCAALRHRAAPAGQGAAPGGSSAVAGGTGAMADAPIFTYVHATPRPGLSADAFVAMVVGLAAQLEAAGLEVAGRLEAAAEAAAPRAAHPPITALSTIPSAVMDAQDGAPDSSCGGQGVGRGQAVAVRVASAQHGAPHRAKAAETGRSRPLGFSSMTGGARGSFTFGAIPPFTMPREWMLMPTHWYVPRRQPSPQPPPSAGAAPPWRARVACNHLAFDAAIASDSSHSHLLPQPPSSLTTPCWASVFPSAGTRRRAPRRACSPMRPRAHSPARRRRAWARPHSRRVVTLHAP